MPHLRWEVHKCIGFLTVVGVEYHTFGGEFVNSVGPDCDRVMRWRVDAPSMDSL